MTHTHTTKQEGRAWEATPHTHTGREQRRGSRVDGIGVAEARIIEQNSTNRTRQQNMQKGGGDA
jgi:hypothetical protein